MIRTLRFEGRLSKGGPWKNDVEMERVVVNKAFQVEIEA